MSTLAMQQHSAHSPYGLPSVIGLMRSTVCCAHERRARTATGVNQRISTSIARGKRAAVAERGGQRQHAGERHRATQ